MGDALAKSYLEKDEVLSTRCGKSHERVVNAKYIVEELKQGSKDSKKYLVRPKKSLLPLEPNTKIRGKLDLRNLVIDKPLVIQDCCFEDEVDLRYCEFKHVVNFSGSTFHRQFNSGDATHSLTIYRKDLICKGTTFEKVASFSRMHVEGDADFADSSFELKSLDKQADSSLESGYTVNFADAQFGHQFVCDGAVFKGPVTFKAIKCGASGSFNKARFITKTRIKDKAEINFNWATFERNLLSRGTEYRAEANFRSIKCGYNAFFERSRCDEEVDLRFLDLGRDLDLRWTYWAKRVKLGQIQVSKKLALGGACFQGAVELYDSNIGVLELWDPNHPNNEPIEVRTTRKDQLETAVHEGQVELKELDRAEEEAKHTTERLKRLVNVSEDVKDRDEAKNLAQKLFPFKLRRGLNLTSITIERFHGGPNEKLAKRLALKLANDQDPAKFSIDPYLQLRNHYLKIGDETTAGAMRVSGYRGLRKNAWSHWRKGEGRTAWSWKRWLAEALLYWPTGYGHRIWTLLVPSIALLFIAGTLTFWPHGALAPASPEIEEPLEVPPPSNYVGKLFQRSIYSLDLLIPALDLRYEAMWVPNKLFSLAYATIHSVVGWILIVLLLAWLTGIIRPRD